MIIKKAADHDSVIEFYYKIIDKISGTEYKPEWKKGVYPTKEYLSQSIDNGELYIGCIGDEIIAAMIVNNEHNESYADVNWPVHLEDSEVTMIHTFCVDPDHGRKGYAKQLVDFVKDKAREEGQKAIRLDVIKGNIPAAELYMGQGFRYIDTIDMFYEDTGWKEFMLYEFTL